MRALVVCLGVLVALGAAEGYRGLLASETYDKCVKAYNSAGGDSGLTSRAPACAPSDMSKFNLQACCGEVKSALGSGEFDRCLCDKEVIYWVEGRISGSGIQGLNSDTFGTFLRACGIPNAKTGGC